MAATEGTFSEHDFLSDLPVVLSATRLAQPLSETPAAMTIIDRQMIRDSGAWDVADLFRLVPGMYVAYNVDKEVVPGHVVSYHGLADPYAKRMQILIDGRSVYTPLFGGPIWSNIPLALDDIERVEVVRGPNAASYGANSFLGVINIITRHPADTQGTLMSFSAGKPGLDATFRQGGRTENSDYRLTVQLRDDRGYTIDPLSLPGSQGLYPRHDDKRITNLSFRSDYRISATDELQMQFGYSGGMRQTGDRPQSNPYREKQVDSQFFLLRWERELSAGNQFSLRLYHNRDSMREDISQLYSSHSLPLGGVTLNFDVLSPFNQPLQHVADRLDLEAQHKFAIDATKRIVWGGSIRRDRVRSLLYLNSKEFLDFTQQNLFANLEWKPLDQLALNLGGMLEHNDSVGTRFSPRLAANYQLAPAHTLRTSLSRAYRNPVLYEQSGNSRWLFSYQGSSLGALPIPPKLSPMFPNGLPIGGTVALQYILGRENLQPERIDSREIGYLLELGAGSSLDLKYAHDSLSNLVEAFQLPCRPGTTEPACAQTLPTFPIGVFDNGGRVAMNTFEAQWQQRFSERTRVFFTWSSARVTDSVSPHAYPYGRSAPRHGQTLLLSHQFTPEWAGSVAGYRVGKVEAIGSTGDFLAAYTRWDSRVARQFKWLSGKAELAASVQNLTNTRFREFYADNVWGRRAYATLRLEF